MKRVLVLAAALGLTACGFIPGSAGDPRTAGVVTSPTPSSLYCVIDINGVINCGPIPSPDPATDPTPIAIGAPQDPASTVTPIPAPTGAVGVPAATAAPAPVVAPPPPPPPPPPLRVDEMGWCSQCAVANLMYIHVFDLSSGAQVPVVGACGTVTVRWPDGFVEAHSGCTASLAPQQPAYIATLRGPFTSANILIRLDFSYQGGHVISCTTPCP